MPKFGYLVVEGPHDMEFAYRLLSPLGFSRIRMERDLDEFLRPLIPRSYPPDGDLQKRMPIPLFLRSTTHVIAVHSAIGDSRLVETVDETRETLDLAGRFSELTGVGIMLDSDRHVPVEQRYEAIREAMLSKGFSLPVTPGSISGNTPRLGVFVLPDNQSTGNLEDLLLECATLQYPDLLPTARAHVDAAKACDGIRGDGEDLSKLAYYNKAIVGTIASVLRPGKAVQTSIQDNRWFQDDALSVEKVRAVQQFLEMLFEI
jgi:hypothetical protein